MSQKECIKCKRIKKLEEFYKNRNSTTSMCKTCTKENNSDYRKNPVIKEREQKRVKENIWKKYGIKNMSYERYEEMLEQQNHSCKICEVHESKIKRKLAVDHNHTTGEIRGLLCDKCNNLLGKVKENISILESAIEYLQNETRNVCI